MYDYAFVYVLFCEWNLVVVAETDLLSPLQPCCLYNSGGDNPDRHPGSSVHPARHIQDLLLADRCCHIYYPMVILEFTTDAGVAALTRLLGIPISSGPGSGVWVFQVEQPPCANLAQPIPHMPLSGRRFLPSPSKSYSSSSFKPTLYVRCRSTEPPF